ncbi:toxin-antitoxin system YwqK family antitoxin [Pseudochryseolinea flava]|nr:hypothetical protein [Pseudochryseolinea flava]
MFTKISCCCILIFISSCDSPTKTYFDNGRLKSVYSTIDGKIEGEYIAYHPNGKMKESRAYSRGELTGPYRRFNDGGIMTSEIYYVRGLKNGQSTTYFDNGKRFSVTQYLGGHKVGEELLFNQDEKCVARHVFDSAGNLIYQQTLWPQKQSRAFPIIHVKSTVVAIGQYCQVGVGFGLPLKGIVDFKVEALDSLLVPFVRVHADTLRDRYKLRLHFVQPGIHKIRLTLRHDAVVGDTLSVDGISEEFEVQISEERATEI